MGAHGGQHGIRGGRIDDGHHLAFVRHVERVQPKHLARSAHFLANRNRAFLESDANRGLRGDLVQRARQAAARRIAHATDGARRRRRQHRPDQPMQSGRVALDARFKLQPFALRQDGDPVVADVAAKQHAVARPGLVRGQADAGPHDPDPGGIDEQPIAAALVHHLGIARHDRNARALRRRTHGLRDGTQRLHRQAFLQDERRAQTHRICAAYREIVDGAVYSQRPNIAAGKKERLHHVGIGGEGQPRAGGFHDGLIVHAAKRGIRECREEDIAQQLRAELPAAAVAEQDLIALSNRQGAGSGYDNALPAQYPASDVKGGGAELQQAVAAGQKSGCSVGLHENYVDYYPNYDYFSINAIARDSQNGLKLSYFNAGRGLQSYATRPTLLTANAATQSPEIHSLYQTNASYIDVNSSVSPWWRSDMDASVAGAGTFAAFRAASAALWSFERTTHGGPVFGEGGSHWFWSGLLDGVEAEFGGGAVANNSSAQAPLFVDFDLLKIHPRQVNYGDR